VIAFSRDLHFYLSATFGSVSEGQPDAAAAGAAGGGGVVNKKFLGFHAPPFGVSAPSFPPFSAGFQVGVRLVGGFAWRGLGLGGTTASLAVSLAPDFAPLPLVPFAASD